MLATKNRAGYCAILCVALAAIVAGCTPAGPRALLDGKKLLDEGQYERAAAKLRIATSLLTTNAQAWNYFGLACHRAGQLTNAVAAYQQALDLNRDLLEARYNLGCVWLDLNKLELAKAEFTSYALRRGNAVEGWLKLGTAQLRARESVAAEKSFRGALRLAPKNAEALNGLGLAQVQRNRPREAAQFFTAALTLQPDYAPGLLNLAIVSQQSLNDRATALEKYRAYLALQPRPANWEAVNVVAQTLDQQLKEHLRPAATNQVIKGPAVTTTNVAKPVTMTIGQTASPQTNVQTPARKPEMVPTAQAEPTIPAAKPAGLHLKAQTAAVAVVTLPPEPVIKTAPGTFPAPTSTNTETPITQAAPGTMPRGGPQDGPTTEKKSFLARINPANLFRHEPESQSDSKQVPKAASKSDPPAASIRTQASPEMISSQGAVTNPPPVQRYSYLAPAKPAAGNRREAERAFAQGQQAHRASRLAEAAQAYRQASQTDPAYFEAYYNLGLVTFESKSFRQSLAAWEHALAIQPESGDARFNFALALKAANYLVDAANELRLILAANENETRAHLVLGNLFAEQFADPAQARAHYLKVLEQHPRHPQATAIRYWLVAHPP